jgi:imidazolonepropionase-like amidohydrolase
MILTALTLSFLAQAPAAGEEPLQVLRAAKVFTSAEPLVIDNGAVAYRGGKIVAVGRFADMDLPPDAVVTDLGDLWLAPGMVEPHGHVGGSLRDLNDMVYLANPELRTHEVVEPANPNVKDGLAGGVTSALLIPGSGTNMGGFGMVVKMHGDTVEDVVMRSPGSLKVAQAGNPERWGWAGSRSRMLMNWNTRRTLARGLEWVRAHRAGEVPMDFEQSAFLGLEDGSVPVSVHTQIYQVVLQTITMQKRDLGLEAFIDHGTFDGFKNAPLAAAYGVPVMNGPRQFWFDRADSSFQGCTANWSTAVSDGLMLGYNTDAPVVPQEELSFQAAMGVRLGHDDPAGALKGVTVYPATALKIQDECGSLEPGLDADFCAWTGFPLDPRSAVEMAWVRGKLAYDAERDGRRF